MAIATVAAFGKLRRCFWTAAESDGCYCSGASGRWPASERKRSPGKRQAPAVVVMSRKQTKQGWLFGVVAGGGSCGGAAGRRPAADLATEPGAVPVARPRADSHKCGFDLPTSPFRTWSLAAGAYARSEQSLWCPGAVRRPRAPEAVHVCCLTRNWNWKHIGNW